METNNHSVQRYKRLVFKLFTCLFLLVIVICFETFFLCYRTLWEQLTNTSQQLTAEIPAIASNLWQAPEPNTIPAGEKGAAIRYGQTLITETARYLGPKGSVQQISNGMNCQNCHLQGGTKPFGNNYSRVATTYPLFRARSNSSETIYKRISDCFERSLNGTAPDSSSKEMMAIKAYIEWLGGNVQKGTIPEGVGIKKVSLLTRAADAGKGRQVYRQQCSNCHGVNGEGQLQPDAVAYTYPPLWGPHSYNDGAGIYRLFNLAGYIKYNMPFGVDYNSARLSDEQAWDVAAYINSQPRPHKDQSADWHNIKQKPVDFPFGPYADTFSEQQHKYGPYTNILH